MSQNLTFLQFLHDVKKTIGPFHGKMNIRVNAEEATPFGSDGFVFFFKKINIYIYIDERNIHGDSLRRHCY